MNITLPSRVQVQVFFWSKNLDMEWLDCRLPGFSYFEQVSKVIKPNYISVSNVWQFLFSFIYAKKNVSDFQLLSCWEIRNGSSVLFYNFFSWYWYFLLLIIYLRPFYCVFILTLYKVFININPFLIKYIKNVFLFVHCPVFKTQIFWVVKLLYCSFIFDVVKLNFCHFYALYPCLKVPFLSSYR